MTLRPYIGEYSDNGGKGRLEKHGEGTFTWGDGKEYRGQWEKDQFHGKGKFSWPDGKVYEGQWAGGQFHGHGTLEDNTGDKYVGEWKAGKRHGEGEQFSKGLSVFEGIFDRDAFTHGTHRNEAGETWKGEFENNTFKKDQTWGEFTSGERTLSGVMEAGKITHGTDASNGEVRYEGQFQNSLYDGQGTYMCDNGKICHGTWRQGKLVHGEVFADKTKFADEKPSYTGDFNERLQQHGYGRLVLSDRGMFEGCFEDGQRKEGVPGTFRWASGECYIGQFHEGKFSPDGKGTFLSATNGMVKAQTGAFNDGQLEGNEIDEQIFPERDIDEQIGQFQQIHNCPVPKCPQVPARPTGRPTGAHVDNASHRISPYTRV